MNFIAQLKSLVLRKKELFILMAIILLAFFLIFFRLTRADMQGDDTHYAFRSIGYIDYMSSQLQTTPIQWFHGELPWWTKLSFHDAPPLFFLTQHLFFKILGINDFVAKLPSAIAGCFLIWIVFLIGKELYNSKVGLLAASLLTINNYFIWISRLGYIESLLSLLIACSLLFLIKGLKKDNFFLLAGLFLGLAMLTKYTCFFLIPIFFIFALIYRQEVLKNKKFWLGLVITAFVFSPVIYYNLMVYKTRGHFDVQFSIVSGLGNSKSATTDWLVLSSRAKWSDHHYTQAAKAFFTNLGNVINWPLFILYIFSFFYLLKEFILIRKNNLGKKHFFLIGALIIGVCFFIFINTTGGHYLAPLNFILALIASCAIYSFYQQYKTKKNIFYPFFFLISIIFLYSLVFSYNTNHRLNKPTTPWLYARIRLENLGFQDLANNLKNKFKNKFSTTNLEFIEIKRSNPLANNNLIPSVYMDNNIYIFDDNTAWFPRIWYLERWRFYNFFNLIEARALSAYLGQELCDSLKKSTLAELYFAQKNPLYFIKALQPYQLDQPEYRGQCPDALTKKLDNDKNPLNKIEPVFNRFGQTVFHVYKFSNLKNLTVCF